MSADPNGVCDFTSLPDVVLTEVLTVCHSPSDKVNLAAVCRRLRLLSAQRRPWRRYGRVVDIVAVSDKLRLTSGRSTIATLSLCDRWKAVSVFDWLLRVCRPKHLRITQHVGSDGFKHPRGRLLRHFYAALPTGTDALSVVKLELDLFAAADPTTMQLLFRRLAPSLTHLHLLRQPPHTLPTSHQPPTSIAFLSECANTLQTLSCNVANTALVATVGDFTALTAVRVAVGQIELLNGNTTSSAGRHLCCRAEPLSVYCDQLCARVRADVSAMCCVPASPPQTDLAAVPLLFPNCRRIEFRGVPCATALNDLCVAYGSTHKPPLQLVLYDPRGDDDGRRQCSRLINVQTVQVQTCAIRRQFK